MIKYVIENNEIKKVEIREEIVTFKTLLMTACDNSFGNITVNEERLFDTYKQANDLFIKVLKER